LKYWLNNYQAAMVALWPLRLILGAIAINSLYNIIYQVLLIKEETKLILFINIISLVAVSIVVSALAERLSVIAGGIGWVVCAFIQLIISIIWFFKKKDSILSC
ncbi:hypothetical protein JGW59_004735, partial [Salmonella enterica]|nr:hypothetical protein [Salmonella enterica]